VIFVDLENGAKSNENENEKEKKIADIPDYFPAGYDNRLGSEVIDIRLKHVSENGGAKTNQCFAYIYYGV